MTGTRLFKKRSKRGLSHVDWAMSLAVFLMYLAWFFIFVKPMLYPSTSMGVLLDVLEDGVHDELFQDVSRIKVFIPGSSEQYEPVIIPFTESWAESKIANSADYFVIDEGKMFFLADLANESLVQMYYPHTALKTSSPRPVIANEAQARSGDFTAFFEDNLLDKVYFDGETRLSGFRIEVDETELDGDGVFSNHTFLAKYQKEGDGINFTSYFFAENLRLYDYLVSNDFRNHSIAIDFSTYNYTYFYMDNINKGELRYSIAPSCKYYTTDFLDLYDANSGIMVAFDRDITLRLCTNDTNPSVRVEFDVSPGQEYQSYVFLHPGPAQSVLNYPLNPVVGVIETLNTISGEKVSSLKNRNYDYLKQLFHYPGAREFNITVDGDDVSASYGIAQPDIADVYARRVEGMMLGKDLSQERVLLTLRVW